MLPIVSMLACRQWLAHADIVGKCPFEAGVEPAGILIPGRR
jgi:hypothetical protein